MKKRFKLAIASLALCTVSCAALGVATSFKANESVVTATGETAQIGTMNTLSGFMIEEKAAVRRENPMGIRFSTTVSAEMKAQIINNLGGDESKVKFGTLIIPTDFLGDNELTHNTPSVVVGEVSAWSDADTYTVVLGGKGGANLSESYYNRPLSARSFAYNMETGEVYYTENTANRSIGYVAYMAQADGDDSSVIADIAEATKKEVVFNENVSIHNDETDGTGLIVNKYEKSSSDVFTLKIGGIVVEEGVDIQYTSSNPDVISATNGVLKAESNGVATITATFTYNGVQYSYSKAVSTDHYVSSSPFKILVPASATKNEMKAAEKLQDIILEATGVELAIITESGNETTADKYLSVGNTVLAQANCAVSDLTKDSASRVKTVGESVFVRGATDAATLYGVQQLLGDLVGYEYYLNNTYVVEQTKEIIIPDKDYVPAIDEVWQIGGTADMVVAEEHCAIGYSSNLIPIGTTDAEDAAGTMRYKGAAHNSILFFNEGVEDSSSYNSSNKAYKKWYATDSSNSYLTNKNQILSWISSSGKIELCYTAHGDSTVKAAMVEKLAAEMFRKMTTIEEFKNYNRIAFSHNDIQNWCECSACNAEGNPSDNMLHFMLDVAANLEAKLANAGDARANTFKLCTLFYNETNAYPSNISSYQSAVDNYMDHMEIWFAETRADYHVSLETSTTWNNTAKSNFDKWTSLANSKGADVLWWGYYMSAKSSFIPYDSIDALRANYALAYNAGVDYMFNQAMQYTVNWVRLKQYLMSELRWNATPDDSTWNGWIEDYMNAAFGPGASAMTEYYEAWNSWADANKNLFNNTKGYSGSGIYKLLSEVCTTSNMSAATLEGWIESCNKAIAALDVNDANYATYYKNIALERMTPLYLIMHLYGFNYSISSSNNPYNAITSYTLKNSAYVLPYAQDFLDAATAWNVYQDGEMTNLDVFKETLTAQLSGITSLEETSKQTVLTGTSITLNSANLVSGESYTATLITSAGEVEATGVAVSDGSVTLTFASAPAVGASNVVLRSNSKVVKFTNVLIVTGTISNYTQLKNLTGKTVSGYYVLTNDITDASGSITLRAGTFSGVLDGNGYTVYGIGVGASGLFRVLTNATIKNVNFVDYGASAPAFGTSATNSVFENVTISFKSGGPSLVTTATSCTYRNVTVYMANTGAYSAPEGVKIVVGADTGKTFYIPEGETEVWLRDDRLVKGDYTVDVSGEVSNASVFAAGNLKVSIKGLALGDILKVSCDNGTAAYVYNVMRVAKISQGDANTTLPIYNGDKTALGYYSADLVQYLEGTVASGWGEAIYNDRARIKAPGTQDYITVDFVAANDFSDTMFQIWPAKGSGSLSKTGVFTDTSNPTGATVSIVDEYGFSVSSVKAGLRYTLRVYDPGTQNLAIGVYGLNTIYFGNVTYGKGTPAEPITPPNVTVGDNKVYSIYEGDETELGYEENTMVFVLENATPDNLYGDGWAKRMIFGLPGTQDYVTFEFVAKEDVVAANVFHVWGENASPSIGTVSASTGKGGDWAIILDKNGLGVTSIKAGEHYFASIACAGLKNVHVGLIDANEVYVANVTYNNGSLPTAIEPLKYAVDNSALSVYEGDETALGFDEGMLVFESTATANTWNDNAVKFSTDSNENCLIVNFALDRALAASGNQFMIWTSNVDGAAAFINNGNVTQNSINIEILDADGNATTTFEANQKYTLKIYHGGASYVVIALVGDTQAGTTIYYSNDYEDTDETYEDPNANLPENVITYSTDGGHSKELVSKYKGDATAYGFADSDYVFEANMTSSWNDRIVIPVDSANYDYMDVEFVVTSGAWYYTAWLVNAGGMLDGSYNVAENTANATYGSGYATHAPNTGANGGKTKIQVLDMNGNVVTGARTNGTRYILRVYLENENLTEVHIGQSNVTMLLANVTMDYTDTITAAGSNKAAVTRYEGDETALGFAAGSRVYTYVGATSNDKLAFMADPVNYDYVDVQMVFDSASTKTYVLGFVLSGSSFLNGADAYILAGDGIRFNANSSNPLDRKIQFLDAEGNVVNTALKTGVVYTLRIYVKANNVTQVQMRQVGVTMYLANVSYGSDEVIEKPENVVVDGETKAELPMYTGSNADIGFASTDYVFEHVTTDSSWASRAHIGNNSVADFLVFDFSVDNPQDLTVWFTRNGNVVGGYSNVVTTTGYIGANECAARMIYVFDADNKAVTQMVANTKYTMWVYLGSAESFHGVAIGNGSNITIHYANIRYVEGTGDNILRQGDANALLPIYDGNVEDLGFADGTFVQTLVGTAADWTEDVYNNRARITMNGQQDYIEIDFAVEKVATGDNFFYIWGASSNGAVTKEGTSSAFTTQILDEYGFAATSIDPGKKYTLVIYDPGATYYGIGAYCENTIYFGNVRYCTGELDEPYALLSGVAGTLSTYTGDVTALGFAEGEYVQQMITEETTNAWDGTRQNLAVDLCAPEGQYVSIMFSLDKDFSASDGNLFFVWCRLGSAWPTNFYVTLEASANARILGTNGEVIEGTLKANTVYMLELYADGVDKYQLANINKMALTVSFATKTLKTYDNSIASAPISGSYNNTVTVSYNNNELGFGRNEVVKQLETETVGNVWSDTQPTSGKGRASWLIKFQSEVGKVVRVRFSVSEDVATATSLFYTWAWDASSKALGNGYVNNTATAEIAKKNVLDVNGNTVTSIKANTVYVLELYAENAAKYDIGNFTAEGMITYVSCDVTYTDYTA